MQQISPNFVAHWAELAEDGHRLGSASANVVLIVFSDYQCRACAQAQEVVDSLRSMYGERLAVVYRHLPLERVHEKAIRAAQAAVCADRQDAFEGMHSLLFAISSTQEEPNWSSLAERGGVLDVAAFMTCLEEDTSEAVVRRQLEAALDAGITRTPTFLFEGHTIVGARSLEAMDYWLQNLIRVGSN